jgi:hypothetical protein
MPSPGFLVLAQQDFTTVSSIDFDNCFSATYKQYKIVCNLTSSSEVDGYFRLRVGGVTNTSNNYNNQFVFASNTTRTAARNSAIGYWLNLIRLPGTTGAVQIVELLNPFQTGVTFAVGAHASNVVSAITLDTRTGSTTVTTSYDGFSVATASGTMTGKITVYGFGLT